MWTQMKTTLLASLLGLSLALNAALAMGHVLGAGNRAAAAADRPAGGVPCLLDRLELDAGQQRRLSEMRRQMRARRAAFWRRAGAIKASLADAICDHGADRADLSAALERYAANQAAMQRAVADHLRAVNRMLRPDQRARFRSLLRAEVFRGIRVSRGAADARP